MLDVPNKNNNVRWSEGLATRIFNVDMWKYHDYIVVASCGWLLIIAGSADRIMKKLIVYRWWSHWDNWLPDTTTWQEQSLKITVALMRMNADATAIEFPLNLFLPRTHFGNPRIESLVVFSAIKCRYGFLRFSGSAEGSKTEAKRKDGAGERSSWTLMIQWYLLLNEQLQGLHRRKGEAKVLEGKPLSASQSLLLSI